MIRFEIGPWEGGEKIGQTHRQTNKRIFVNYNIDAAVYYWYFELQYTPYVEETSIVLYKI